MIHCDSPYKLYEDTQWMYRTWRSAWRPLKRSATLASVSLAFASALVQPTSVALGPTVDGWYWQAGKTQYGSHLAALAWSSAALQGGRINCVSPISVEPP